MLYTDEKGLEWRWCLVGNIVDQHPYGQEHTIMRGNKQFRPGAKVYINLVYMGMGSEAVLVIGKPRRSSRLIEIAVKRKLICSFRVQKVFDPAVLKKMDASEHSWYGCADEVHEELMHIAAIFNADYEKQVKASKRE